MHKSEPLKQIKGVIDFIDNIKFFLENNIQLEVLKRMTKRMDMIRASDLFEEFEDHFHNPIDMQEFEFFVNTFGIIFSPQIYTYMKLILKGEVPKELKKIVFSKGKKGVLELKKFIESKKQELVHAEESINLSELSDFEKEIYRYVLRFDGSEWGREYDFNKILERLYDNKQHGHISKKDDAFEVWSPSLRAMPLNLDLSKFDEPYAGIRKAIRKAYQIEGIEQQRILVRDLLTEQIQEKEKFLQSAKNENQQKALTGQKRNYELLLKHFENTQFEKSEELLEFLLSSKTLVKKGRTVIESIVLNDFMMKNLDKLDKLKMLENERQINVRNVRKLVNIFKNHIQDHALSNIEKEQYKKDWLYPHMGNKERSLLRKICSTRGLEEIESILARIDGGEVKDAYIFQPSRYIMGEMSGYLADACWTEQEDILKDNPNMTPIICVKSPDENAELVGATLLFENSINNGQDKVLIIRGINPQDKVLEKVSAHSFCKNTIEYAENVAHKKGIKYIVACIDDGIISNRPGVVNYFKENYPTKEEAGDNLGIGNFVELDKEMDFNDYEITDKCQVISILS